MDKYETDKGYNLNLPLWVHIRAAIRGKPGAVALLNSENGYFGIVAPMYRVTTDNYEVVTQRKLAYFARGRFFNATGRTHDAYVGMVGSRPVETELPTAIELMEWNVDGQGASMNDFALEAVSEVLTTARYGVLVEPPNTAGATLADVSLPKFIAYNAEQIIKHVVHENKLVQVDLLEVYTTNEDGEWKDKERVRRLELVDGVYQSRIKEGQNFGEPVVAVVNGSTLDYIPFQFIGSENNKPSYDRPVLFDLAHENLGHFQLSCDNLENLHYHGQGMTNIYSSMDSAAFYEMNPNGLDVGAKGVNMLEQGDRVELLQLAATGAIPEEMAKVERRMIMLGAQVVQDNQVNQTLGAKEIEANATTSQLKRIANNVSAGLTNCAEWAADMVGANPDEAKVTVNDQFITDNMTAQDVMAAFQAVQGSALPVSVLHDVAKKAGYTSKDSEELIEEISEEGMGGESEEMARLRMENDNLRAQLNGEDDGEN